MDATYLLSGGFKPTIKRFADLDGPDFFPTPAWATHALIENEKFSGDIWECACGDGTMSRVLETTGVQVISSDPYRRGFGEVGVNFLDNDRCSDNIITNPPYNSAEGFVASGVSKARRKFACCDLPSLKELIEQIRSFRAAPQTEFGCSANVLRFIRPAQQ